MYDLRADVLYPNLIYKLQELINTDDDSFDENNKDVNEKFYNEQINMVSL